MDQNYNKKNDLVRNVTLRENERLDYVNDGLSLIQNVHHFRFGTDALLLSSFIHGNPNARVIELGCGTGIISLLLLQRKKAKAIDALEIQEYFADLSVRNAMLNGYSERMHVYNTDIRMPSDNICRETYNYCVSNPPYFSELSGICCDNPQTDAARREKNGTIDDFCACAEKVVKFGGEFYLVHRPDRLTDVLDSLRRHHFEPKRMTFVLSENHKSPALFLLESKRGGAPGSLRITEPLILSDYPTVDLNTDPYAPFFEHV